MAGFLLTPAEVKEREWNIMFWAVGMRNTGGRGVRGDSNSNGNRNNRLVWTAAQSQIAREALRETKTRASQLNIHCHERKYKLSG